MLSEKELVAIMKERKSRPRTETEKAFAKIRSENSPFVGIMEELYLQYAIKQEEEIAKLREELRKAKEETMGYIHHEHPDILLTKRKKGASNE